MALTARAGRLLDWERLAVWVLAALLVGARVGVAYLGTPHTAPPAELQDARATSGVGVTDLDGRGGYVLAPTDADSTTGFVFYPGGRVHPDAYLPVLAPVAVRANVTIVVVKPPLNLAVLDPDRADAVLRGHPEIDRWYVGGHSLGGAMACRYADRQSERVVGLVLLGSYCDRDVSDTELRVLSVRGGRDTVVGQELSATVRRLPANRTTTVTIQGMNHSQFGSYRGQRGDSPATITYERAHAELRGSLVAFLEEGNAGDDQR